MQISKLAHGQVIIGHSWVLLLLFLGPLQDENVRHLFERVSELRQQYEDQMMECWEAPEDDQDMYEDIPSDHHVSEVTGDPLEAPAPNPETPKAMMLRHRSKASTASLAEEPPASVAASPESAAAVPTDMLETMTEAQKIELASLVMQMESINLQSRTHLLLRNMHAIFTQASYVLQFLVSYIVCPCHMLEAQHGSGSCGRACGQQRNSRSAIWLACEP